MSPSSVTAATLVLLLLLQTAPASHARQLQQIPRLIGGMEIDPTRYPYFVSLLEPKSRGKGKQLACGGTLVAPDVVLTAAHCIGVKWAEWGRDFKERNGQKRHTRRVVDFVSHPDFYYDLFENDVALIKLDMPFDEAEIVKLPERSFSSETLDGREVTLIGRGMQSDWMNEDNDYDSADDDDDDDDSHAPPSSEEEEDDTPQHQKPLEETKVIVVPTAACRQEYNNAPLFLVITDNMFCAAAPGQDSCLGDSGGPGILRGRTWRDDVQVGVISWGDECASDRFPGVLTRLTAVMDFVTEILGVMTDPSRQDSPSKFQRSGGRD
eukprot:jgi/Tetstr1/431599/TSEL_021129.t1